MDGYTGGEVALKGGTQGYKTRICTVAMAGQVLKLSHLHRDTSHMLEGSKGYDNLRPF